MKVISNFFVFLRNLVKSVKPTKAHFEVKNPQSYAVKFIYIFYVTPVVGLFRFKTTEISLQAFIHLSFLYVAILAYRTLTTAEELLNRGRDVVYTLFNPICDCNMHTGYSDWQKTLKIISVPLQLYLFFFFMPRLYIFTSWFWSVIRLGIWYLAGSFRTPFH